MKYQRVIDANVIMSSTLTEKKKDSEIYFRQDRLNIIIKPAAIIALHKEIQSQ